VLFVGNVVGLGVGQHALDLCHRDHGDPADEQEEQREEQAERAGVDADVDDGRAEVLRNVLNIGVSTAVHVLLG
jgi:hypothetical protein